MSKSNARTKEAEAVDNPDVVIVKVATAPKLSPRGEGGITYQIGRIGESVYVRIEKNEGGGSHSREFVPVSAISTAITPAMKRGATFKSDALKATFVGKSQCNSGFLVAVLRAENIFSADPEHKGLSKVTSDLDAWEKAMREAAPVLKDDGQPETVKLYPEIKDTCFRPKQASTAPDAAPDNEPVPNQRQVRTNKKVSTKLANTSEAENTPVDDSKSTEPSGETDSTDE